MLTPCLWPFPARDWVSYWKPLPQSLRKNPSGPPRVLAVPSALQRLCADSGLCHTSTEQEEQPLQQAKVKVGFVLSFFFFIAVFLQCLNLVLPEVNTVCGNLQVLSYSSAHPRRRRKVGSETQVEKHD